VQPEGRGPRDDRALAEAGLLVLEGSFLVERGRDAGLGFESLQCVPSREAWARGLGISGLEPAVMAEAEIAREAGYPFHRGVRALARRPSPRGAEELAAQLGREAPPDTVLALPEAVDPANLGSAFRSAAALGCSALLLGPGGPDPFCRRALRASMGATLSLPWSRLDGPGGFRPFADAGYEAAACVLDPAAKDLRSFARPPRLLLALGNEAFGLSPPWLEACPLALTLPMLGGADSLNLAAAAAIFLYALGPGA
jgi:tRNA G18 (ribose-2'-O)-methylase SpoU